MFERILFISLVIFFFFFSFLLVFATKKNSREISF